VAEVVAQQAQVWTEQTESPQWAAAQEVARMIRSAVLEDEKKIPAAAVVAAERSCGRAVPQAPEAALAWVALKVDTQVAAQAALAELRPWAAAALAAATARRLREAEPYVQWAHHPANACRRSPSSRRRHPSRYPSRLELFALHYRASRAERRALTLAWLEASAGAAIEQMANLQSSAVQAASDLPKTSAAVALAWRFRQIQEEARRVGHMAEQPGELRVDRQLRALAVVVGQATSSA
jgi:hypothetical protein